MHKHIAIIFGILFVSLSLQAQIHIFLNEQGIDLDDGRLSAWVFPIPGEMDDAFDSFQDYCKERSDLRLKNGGENILIAEKISLPNISTKRGDLIAYAYDNNMYNAFAVAFQLGYDISLNSKEFKVEMGTLRNYTKEFMTYLYAHHYSDKIEVMQKEQKSLEKDLAKENSNINSLKKKVAGLRSKIEKETETSKIEELNVEVNAMTVEIEDISALLPVISSRIEDLKREVNKYQTESLQYHNVIASL